MGLQKKFTEQQHPTSANKALKIKALKVKHHDMQTNLSKKTREQCKILTK